MIYNKMHHILYDEKEKKKREMGSRNLNSQAKLMITEPSLSTLLSKIDNRRNGEGQLTTLPSLPTRRVTMGSKISRHETNAFELQPIQQVA